MKVLGVIPARYASTRFPGKPLVDIGGKSMIERVYAQVRKATLIDHVVVATDDIRIMEHVQGFGGNVVLTSQDHPSGTDRCFEALQQVGEDFQYVINIQGDEPFIRPEQIDLLAALLDGDTFIATLVKELKDEESLFNPNIVKAVVSQQGQALYFSRSPIPHARNIAEKDWLSKHKYFKHIGLYGYRADILEQLTKLPPSPLELVESLEQLRWLDNGYIIQTAETKSETIGIDTPEDLQRALDYLKKNKE